MTSRDGRAGFTKGWFIAGAAATLLAAAGARAEDARAEVKQPGGAQPTQVARANGGTGSAAPAEVSDWRGSGAVSPKTATSPARRDAASAAERGGNGYDEARELVAGNSGGRG